jgi:hypothetical protein
MFKMKRGGYRRLVTQGAAAAVVVATLGVYSAGYSSASTTAKAVAHTVPGATNPKFVPPNLKGKTFSLLFDTSVGTNKIQVIHAASLLSHWGANASINYVDSLQAGIAAVLRGSADTVAEDEQTGLQAISAGVNIIAYGVAQAHLDDVFVCKPSIKTISEVTKGVTIGVIDTTGINLIESILALKAAHLTLSDAHLIITGTQSQRGAAMLSGRTDCTMLSYGTYLKFAPQGYNNVFSYISSAKVISGDLLYSTPQWLASHAQMAVAMNEAMILSNRWVDNKANEAAYVKTALNSVPGTTKQELQTVFAVYEKNVLCPPNEILSLAQLKTEQTEELAIGALTKKNGGVIPVTSFGNPIFGQEALVAVGKAS